jgi:microcystin-dependent protein
MTTRETPSAPPLPRRDFLGRLSLFVAGTMLLGRPKSARASTLSIEPYIGEIMLCSFNFPPKGWALCNGQLLPINQNQALYSILGTTYGGNGTTNFALPNLQGRMPIHAGQGPGLSSHVRGESSGEAYHALTVAELPSHTHAFNASTGGGTTANPANMHLARSAAGVPLYGPTANTTMVSNEVSSVGGNQSHVNQQPYLVMNYVIALQGIFPTP